MGVGERKNTREANFVSSIPEKHISPKNNQVMRAQFDINRRSDTYQYIYFVDLVSISTNMYTGRAFQKVGERGGGERQRGRKREKEIQKYVNIYTQTNNVRAKSKARKENKPKQIYLVKQQCAFTKT